MGLGNNTFPILYLRVLNNSKIYLYSLLGHQENWTLSQDEYNSTRRLHQRIYSGQQYLPLSACFWSHQKEAHPSECLWGWHWSRNTKLCWAVSFLNQNGRTLHSFHVFLVVFLARHSVKSWQIVFGFLFFFIVESLFC